MRRMRRECLGDAREMRAEWLVVARSEEKGPQRAVSSHDRQLVEVGWQPEPLGGPSVDTVAPEGEAERIGESQPAGGGTDGRELLGGMTEGKHTGRVRQACRVTIILLLRE